MQSVGIFRRLPSVLKQIRFVSSDSVVQKGPRDDKVPAPKEVTKENAVYDQITHTGQASFKF
jgi:hypothetical protein